MYLGQHWASDIFAGAFLGTFYGMRVVDYSHTHQRTKVDRLFLGPMKTAQLAPADGGYSVSWSIKF
jgi:membrane-associated phospholipid phosphatase